MKCLKCGYDRNLPGDKKCRHCGARLDDKKAQIYDERAEFIHKNDQDRQAFYGRDLRVPKGNYKDFIPIIVVVGIAVVFMAIFFSAKFSRERAAENPDPADTTESTSEATTEATTVTTEATTITTEITTAVTTEVTTEAVTEEKASETDALDRKQHDITAGVHIYNLLSNFQFMDPTIFDGYEGTYAIISGEIDLSDTGREEKPMDEENNKRMVNLTEVLDLDIQYSEELDAKGYTVLIDKDGVIKVYIHTSKDPLAYEIAPECCPDYEMPYERDEDGNRTN